MKRIDNFLYRLRKFNYTAFIISALAMAGHETDFSWLGWGWTIAAFLFGAISIYTLYIQIQREE